MKRILFFIIIGAMVAVTLVYSGAAWAAEAVRGKNDANMSRVRKEAEWATIE